MHVLVNFIDKVFRFCFDELTTVAKVLRISMKWKMEYYISNFFATLLSCHSGSRLEEEDQFLRHSHCILTFAVGGP